MMVRIAYAQNVVRSHVVLAAKVLCVCAEQQTARGHGNRHRRGSRRSAATPRELMCASVWPRCPSSCSDAVVPRLTVPVACANPCSPQELQNNPELMRPAPFLIP